MFAHNNSSFNRVAFVFHLWNFVFTHVKGLHCYSCQKFTCDKDRGNCYDMKQWSLFINDTGKMFDKWHAIPNCTFDLQDFTHLNSSPNYIESCSQEIDSCGSHFIRITATVTRIRNLNETEYPILNPPNYFYSTIVAVGCVKPLITKNLNATAVETNTHPCSENILQMEYQSTSYGNPVKVHMKSEHIACSHCNQSLCNFDYRKENFNPPSSSASDVTCNINSFTFSFILMCTFIWTHFLADFILNRFDDSYMYETFFDTSSSTLNF